MRGSQIGRFLDRVRNFSQLGTQRAIFHVQSVDRIRMFDCDGLQFVDVIFEVRKLGFYSGKLI